MLSDLMALFVSRFASHTITWTAVRGCASLNLRTTSGGKSTPTAATGGRRRSRRSHAEQPQQYEQPRQLEQQQDLQPDQHQDVQPEQHQDVQPEQHQDVQQDHVSYTQQLQPAGRNGPGATGGSNSRQPQQQRKVEQLWTAAAQLHLKRGSDIPEPVDRRAAARGISSTDGSNSSMASGSRSRRSRAQSRPGGSSNSSSNSSSSNSIIITSSSTVSSSGTAPALLNEHAAVATSSAGWGSAPPQYTSDAAADNLQKDVAAAGSSGKTGSSDRASSLGGSSDAVVAAIARLGRFLDFRERSSKEVLTKLEALEYDKATALQVLAALQEAGLQSDARFADMFVRTYWKGKAQSPWRLAYELRSRGVAQQHIDAAMAAVFGPSRQLSAAEILTEQEAEAWEHLVEVCRRQVELTSTEPQQKRKTKLYRWLQRRGHNNSTIFKIFEAVGLQHS